MSRRIRTSWRTQRLPASASLLAMLVIVCALALSDIASGQSLPVLSQPHTFNIDSQPLARALLQFSRDTGIDVFFDDGHVTGHHSAGVRGELTAEQALRQILRGSGLRHEIKGNAVTLAPEASITGARMLDPVRVEGRIDDAIEQTYTAAGSLNVITRAELDKVAISSARDVLAEVPGVWVSDGRQNPGININIRGMQGPGRNNVMVDGTRQNASRYNGYAGNNSAVYVDPELIAGITVEKGATTGVHGAGSIGGVVNLRTLSVTDVLQENQRIGGQVRASFGSSDGRYPGVASVAGAWRINSRVDLTAAVSRRDMDEYASGRKDADPRMLEPPSIFSPPPIAPGEDVPNTHQQTLSGLLKLGVQLRPDQRLVLGATQYRSEYAFDNRLGSAASGSFYEPMRTTAYSITANHSWKHPDSRWLDAQANLWLTSTRDENLASDSELGGAFDRQLRTWGGELYNQSSLSWGRLEGVLKYGGEWFKDDGRRTDVAGEREVGGLFVQATLMPLSWLQLEIAGRYDSYTLQGRGRMSGPLSGQNSYPFVMDRGDTRWNPGVSLSLFPWEGLQLYARYSEGFRPPTLTEAMMSGVAFLTPIRPNLQLRPEVAYNREVGINFFRRGVAFSQDGLGLRVAAFDNRYDDYINRRYQGGGLTTTPLMLSFANLQRARFQGWEVQARYDAGLVFFDVSHTQFRRITFCDAGVCSGQVGGEGDFGAPFLPPGLRTVGNAGVRIPALRLVLGARLRRDSEVMEVATQNDYTGTRWAPYRIHDAYLHYGITAGLRLSVSVENIEDKYYVDANAGWRRVAAPGRSFSAAFQYVF